MPALIGLARTLVVAFFIACWAPVANGSGPVESLLEARQRHVVLQQWDLSCGAAALATVLRYQHEVPVTERSVALGLIDRPEYIADPGLVRLRRGFSLFDMKRFVDGMGYQGVGLGRLEFDDLLEHAPIIVPVDLRGYPHFVVFRGATKQRVLLADPAFGQITVERDRFMAAWSAIDELGRVGFTVQDAGGQAPPGELRAGPSDFLMFR